MGAGRITIVVIIIIIIIIIIVIIQCGCWVVRLRVALNRNKISRVFSSVRKCFHYKTGYILTPAEKMCIKGTKYWQHLTCIQLIVKHFFLLVILKQTTKYMGIAFSWTISLHHWHRKDTIVLIRSKRQTSKTLKFLVKKVFHYQKRIWFIKQRQMT